MIGRHADPGFDLYQPALLLDALGSRADSPEPSSSHMTITDRIDATTRILPAYLKAAPPAPRSVKTVCEKCVAYQPAAAVAD